MDLDKLKVVDLRKELQQRGLDTKGNKAVLVKRLKDAMDKESDKDVGNNVPTTEPSDGDGSHNDDDEEQGEDIKREVISPKKEVIKSVVSPEKDSRRRKDLEIDSNSSDIKHENVLSEEGTSDKYKEEESSVPDVEIKHETNGEQMEDIQTTDVSAENKEVSENEKMETENIESRGEKRKRDEDDEAEQAETQEEKRRREEKDSPQKSPIKQEKVPPKEDEPDINYDKPQLSWFDSDLHLQVEKQNFLSAKPLNEGCMGYIWAGARATHGVAVGKVCFEVKLTEKLQWDDPSKLMQERKDKEIQSNKYKIDRRKENKASSDQKTKPDKNENPDNKETSESVEKEVAENADESEKNIKSEESYEKEHSETETVEGEKTVEAENGNEENEVDNQKSEDDKVQKESEEDMNSSEADQPNDTEQGKEKSENTPKLDTISTHYFRVGFSVLGTSLQLGEDKYSFGYQSTGKFVSEKQFKDYGIAFDVGDVVGSYVSINDENVSFTFTVNGALQPTAITLPRSDFPQEKFALFPHVLSRNYAFELNFGARDDPWFPHPEELKDYQFLEHIEEKVTGPKRPDTRSECEVILMIGLPGSGKTTWVKKHLESSEKLYTVIGNNPIFERMTVDGQPLKSRFGGSWKILVDKIQKCLNILTDIASLRRRNFIIDQTNVFPNAQRRKLRSFEGFSRKAVCVICEDEEHARRQKEHENDYGKSIPESTMLDLKAQMELPQKCEWLEELIFTDLNEEDARKKLKQYTEEANKKGYYRRWFNRQEDRKGNLRNFHGGRAGYRGGRNDRFPQYSRGGWGRPMPGWERERKDFRVAPRQDAWRQPPRAGPPRGGLRPAERARPRDNRGAAGYANRNQLSGRNTVSRQNSGSGSWNSGNSQGGWNAQTYGSHSYGSWPQQGQGWKYNAQSGYNSITHGGYGNNQGQGGYGNNLGQGGYGNNQGYSNNQGGYGNSHGGYGNSQSGYGNSQGGYGNSQGGYGNSQGGAYGNNQGGYGSQSGYGQQNWNYYGQYSQQQGWGSSQRRK